MSTAIVTGIVQLPMSAVAVKGSTNTILVLRLLYRYDQQKVDVDDVPNWLGNLEINRHLHCNLHRSFNQYGGGGVVGLVEEQNLFFMHFILFIARGLLVTTGTA